MTQIEQFTEAIERARAGGPERHRAKAAEQGKLPVRERIARLVDEGSFTEEALLANWEQDGLGADGVVTGTATVPSPVTTPSAPRPSPSQLARSASSVKEPSSTRRAIRSRTGSLPCSAALAR